MDLWPLFIHENERYKQNSLAFHLLQSRITLVFDRMAAGRASSVYYYIFEEEQEEEEEALAMGDRLATLALRFL